MPQTVEEVDYTDLAQFINRAWANLLPFGIPTVKSDIRIEAERLPYLLNTYVEGDRKAFLYLERIVDRDSWYDDEKPILTLYQGMARVSFRVQSRVEADKDAIVMLGSGQVVGMRWIEGLAIAICTDHMVEVAH